MSIVSRNLNILDYAVSLLLRKLLKNLMILVVFSAVIFLLGSFQLVTSALKSSSDVLLTGVPDITVQQMSAGRQVNMQESAGSLLHTVFGISRIRKRIWGYYFDEKNGANYTVIGLGADSIDQSLTEALQWGRLPAQPGEVVAAGAVIENLQLGSRKSFSLFRPDLSLKSLRLVGQFQRHHGMVAGDLLLMSQTDAADLFSISSDEITDLLVDVANPLEIDTIAGKISDRLSGTRVITRKQIAKTYDVVFSWRSGFGSVCLLTSVFAFIILAWDRASGLSSEEQREMAILKVTGWQTRDLMMLRFWESAVIALLSFLIGYSLAWFHITLANGILLRPVLLGWSVLEPTWSFSPPLLLADMLVIAACSVIPYQLATILPAWKSAMVRPDSVI